MTRTLRIAWLGPAPRTAGGVAEMGGSNLAGLLDLGHSVDCYIARQEEPLPPMLEGRERLRVVLAQDRWRPGAWYSRGALPRFVTGQGTRALAFRKLAGELAAEHARRPYDVVYQFSAIELFGLRRRLPHLPPLVLHPETHIAGELRWFRRERSLVSQCEPRRRRLAIQALLASRTAVQRRDAKLPQIVVCPSRAFRDWLVHDYGVDSARTRIIRNPVDLDRFAPTDRRMPGPVRVLFVGRISVRKGVEQVVALSRRLGDLAGLLTLDIVGEETQWSDYRRLLDDLDPRIAVYRGGVDPLRMPELLAQADLLVQPSKYEPFGLTVAESLASGVPVVATTEVGAAEDVSEGCIERVPVEDLPALEGAVRGFVARLAGSGGDEMRLLARREAERLFCPRRVAAQLARALEEAAV